MLWQRALKPVFAHEPFVRVKGSLLQCQLLETALNLSFNFQTLIATKASRVVFASQGREVLEFGLRRAQGVDGALTASRSIYLGAVMPHQMCSLPDCLVYL